jgi:hypothetical protein
MTQTAARSGMCKNFATNIVNRLTIPPRFALSVHGVRRVGRFNALALLKSRDAEDRVSAAWVGPVRAGNRPMVPARARARGMDRDGRGRTSKKCFPAISSPVPPVQSARQ